MEEMEILKQKITTEVLQSDYAEKKIVFGEGKQNAKICMIGEAPGGDEEKQGRPFVGKAGKNLSSFLETIGLKREEIYITNVVKFRPTNVSPKTGNFVNRPPKKTEVDFFLPYLKKMMKSGAVLLADNVMFHGYVENIPHKKDRAYGIAVKMNEFLHSLLSDKDFESVVLEVGDGVSLSVLKWINFWLI